MENANKSPAVLVVDVQLPLENVEYAISQYLRSKGGDLDHETHALLTGVRACVGRVADQARRLHSGTPADTAPLTPPGGTLDLRVVGEPRDPWANPRVRV